MGPQEDYIETVLTCEGDYYDPDFHNQLQDFSQRLQDLLVTDQRQLVIKKVEPWNSVRVTFNIPKEAAVRLRRLAEQGDHTLRELGILAVQIEGDRVISLTIAGKNNETTELVFQTSAAGAAGPRKVPVFESFDASSSDEIGNPGPSNVETTRQNIKKYLRQQGSGDNILDNIFSQPGATVDYKLPGTVGINPEPRNVRHNHPVVPFPMGSPSRSPSHSAGGPGQLPGHFPSRSPPGYPSPSHSQSLQSFPSPSSGRSLPSPSGQLSPRYPTPPPQLQHIQHHRPGSPGVRIPPQIVSIHNQPQGSVQGQMPGSFPLPYHAQHGHMANQPINNLRVGANKDITSSSPLLVNLLQSDPAAHFNSLPQHKMPPPFDGGCTPKKKRRKKKDKDKPPISLGNLDVDNSLQTPPIEGRVPQLGMEPHLTNSTSPGGSGSGSLPSTPNLTPPGSAHPQMGRSPVRPSPDKSSGPRHIINPYTGKLEPVDSDGDDSIHKMETGDSLEHTGQLQPPPNPLVALEKRLARDTAAIMQNTSPPVTGDYSPTSPRGSPRFLNPASQTTVPPPSRVHNHPEGFSLCVSSSLLPVMSSASMGMSVATSNSVKAVTVPQNQESHFHHPSVSEPPNQNHAIFGNMPHPSFSRGVFPPELKHPMHRMDVRHIGSQMGPHMLEFDSSRMRHPGPPFAPQFRGPRPSHLGTSTGIPVRPTSAAAWSARTSTNTTQHFPVNPASSSGLASGHRPPLNSGYIGRPEHGQLPGDLRHRMPGVSSSHRMPGVSSSHRMPGVSSSHVHPSQTVTLSQPSLPWLATTAVSSEHARTLLTTALPHKPVANPGTMPHSVGPHHGATDLNRLPVSDNKTSTGLPVSVMNDTGERPIRATGCANIVTSFASVICSRIGDTRVSAVTSSMQAVPTTVKDTSSASAGGVECKVHVENPSENAQSQSVLLGKESMPIMTTVSTHAPLSTIGISTDSAKVSGGLPLASERNRTVPEATTTTTMSARLPPADRDSNGHEVPLRASAPSVASNTEASLDKDSTQSAAENTCLRTALVTPEGRETVAHSIATESTVAQDSKSDATAPNVSATTHVGINQESNALSTEEAVCTGTNVPEALEDNSTSDSSRVSPVSREHSVLNMLNAATPNTENTIEKDGSSARNSGLASHDMCSIKADTNSDSSNAMALSHNDATNNNKVKDSSKLPSAVDLRTTETEEPLHNAAEKEEVDINQPSFTNANTNGGEDISSSAEHVPSNLPCSSPKAASESSKQFDEGSVLAEDTPVALGPSEVIGPSNGMSTSETSPMSDATVTSGVSHGQQSHSPIHNSIVGHENHDSELSSHSFDELRFSQRLTNASPVEDARIAAENHDSGLSSQSLDGEPSKEVGQAAPDNAPPKDNVENVITVGYALSKEAPIDLAPLGGLSDKLLTPGLKGLDSIPFLTKPGMEEQGLENPETSKGISLTDKLVVENPLLKSKPHLLVREVHLPQIEGPTIGHSQDTDNTGTHGDQANTTYQIHLNWHDKSFVPSKFKEKCDLNPGGGVDKKEEASCADSSQINGEGINLKGGCRDPSAMLADLGACNSDSCSNDERDFKEHSQSHLTEHSLTSPSHGSIGDKVQDDTLQDFTCSSDKISVTSMANASVECSNKADRIISSSDNYVELVPIPVDIPCNKDKTLEISSVDKEPLMVPLLSDPEDKVFSAEEDPHDSDGKVKSCLDSKLTVETEMEMETENAASQVIPVTLPLEGRMVAHSSGGQIQKQDASPQYGDTPPEGSTEGLPPTMESSEVSSAAIHPKIQLGTQTMEVASDTTASSFPGSELVESVATADGESNSLENISQSETKDTVEASVIKEVESNVGSSPAKDSPPLSISTAGNTDGLASSSSSKSPVNVVDKIHHQTSIVTEMHEDNLLKTDFTSATSHSPARSDLISTKQISLASPPSLKSSEEKGSTTTTTPPKTVVPLEISRSPTNMCRMMVSTPLAKVDSLIPSTESTKEFPDVTEKEISPKVNDLNLIPENKNQRSTEISTTEFDPKSVISVVNKVFHMSAATLDDHSLSSDGKVLNAEPAKTNTSPVLNLPASEGLGSKPSNEGPMADVKDTLVPDGLKSEFSVVKSKSPVSKSSAVVGTIDCVTSFSQKDVIPSRTPVTSNYSGNYIPSKLPISTLVSSVITTTSSVSVPESRNLSVRSQSVVVSLGSSAASLVSNQGSPSVGSSASTSTSVTSILDTRMTTSISFRDVTSQDTVRHSGFPVLSIPDTDSRIVLKGISPTERTNKDSSSVGPVTVNTTGAVHSPALLSVSTTLSKTLHVNTSNMVTSVIHSSGIKSSHASFNLTKAELCKSDVRMAQSKGISIMQPLIDREAEIEDDPEIVSSLEKKNAVLLKSEKEPVLLRPEEMLQIRKAGASLDSAMVQLLPQKGPGSTFTIAQLIEETKPNKTDIKAFMKSQMEELIPCSSQANTQTVMTVSQVKTAKAGIHKGQQSANKPHTAPAVTDFPRNSSLHLSNFVQKSMHTPSLVNSAPHPITSPGFPLNLTESVQKVMQAIPKETPSPPSQPPKLNRPASSLTATKTIVIPPGKASIAGSTENRQEGTVVIVLSSASSSAGNTVSGLSPDGRSANQHSKSPVTIVPSKDKSPSQAAKLNPKSPVISPSKKTLVDLHRGRCSTTLQYAQEPLSVKTSLPQSSQNTVPQKSPVRTVSIVPEGRPTSICNPHVEHNYISLPRSHDPPSHHGLLVHSGSKSISETPYKLSPSHMESEIPSLTSHDKLSKGVGSNTCTHVSQAASPPFPRETMKPISPVMSIYNPEQPAITSHTPDALILNDVKEDHSVAELVQEEVEVKAEPLPASVTHELGKELTEVSPSLNESKESTKEAPKMDACNETPAKSGRMTRRTSLDSKQSTDEIVAPPARITRRSSRESTESVASNSDSVKTPSSRGRQKSISECSDASTDLSTRSVCSERSEEREISPSLRNPRRSGRKRASPDGQEEHRVSETRSESPKVTRCSKRKLALEESKIEDIKKSRVEEGGSDTVLDIDYTIKGSKSKGPPKASNKGGTKSEETEKIAPKGKKSGAVKEDLSPAKGVPSALKPLQPEAVDLNLDDHTYSGTKRTKAKNSQGAVGRAQEEGIKPQTAVSDTVATKGSTTKKGTEKIPRIPLEEGRGRGHGTGKESEGEPVPGTPPYKRATRSTRQKDHYELPPPLTKRRRSRDHR